MSASSSPTGIGLQLWSLRREFATDAVGTLSKVHGLGFDAVETAGTYDWAAAQWKERLAENKLSVSGAHIGDKALFGELESQIAFQGAIGNRRYILPSISEEQRTPEGYRQVAAKLNQTGKTLQAQGASVLYHNHAFEFDPLKDGGVGYDILLQETDPSLVRFQVDCYWVAFAGKDPLKFLGEHAARIGAIHAKQLRFSDRKEVSLEQGDIDFDPIVKMAREHGWPIVVEFEGEDAIEAVRRGARYLHRLGA